MLFRNWLEHNEVLMPNLFDKLRSINNKFVGVHFTNMNELSYFLSPHHYDPIGIYCFPKEYVLSGGLSKNSGFYKKKNMFILAPSSSAKILNLDMSRGKAEELLKKMGIDVGLLDDKEVYHNSGSTIGHRFWGALENFRNKNKLSRNMSWNSLFSKTGYNVLYDPNMAIVHSHEPSQIIYLDHKAYEILDILNNNNNKLISTFASYFSDFRKRKKKKYFHNDRYSLYLTKSDNSKYRNIEINLDFDENTPERLRVTVYGLKDKEDERDYSSKEFNFSINSNDDLMSAIREVKKYIDSSERKENIIDNSEYDVMFRISKQYRLKIDENYPGAIERRYKDAMYKLTYTPSKNILSLAVHSTYSSWRRFHYYYDVEYNGNIEDSIKKLFDGLKEKIKADLDNYDYGAALRFVEFLEKRVFVIRNNS